MSYSDPTPEEDKTYRIVRFYHHSQNKPKEVIDRGLSKQAAVNHCNDKDSEEKGVFFDGFEEE